MGIFGRLTNVIKSNLNALVDQAEDPEKLIGQTVLDMEAELKKARRELVTTLGTAKRLEKKAVELGEEAAGWEEKAVLALRSGDEELAREALRRKTRTLKEAENVRAQAAQQASAGDAMKDTIERVERKIDDLKARKGTLAAQVRRAREAPPEVAGVSSSRFGSETFDELERMTSRIDQLDAEVEVHQVLEDPKRADVDARFRKLERSATDDTVDDELAALKRKLEG
ncbi:MAG: PspA/IM30 family protein [Polyangiaceae bacterium]|nr:PspA/IM30 family protein [Polyangiaceae bacterium]